MPEGITTSMYQPAPQVNPLGVVHEFAGAQAQLNQARTFQMEFAARQALGPMLKASIRPDGSVDTAKLFQMVAAHPATGWKLPDLVEGFLKNQLTTQDIARKHLEIAQGHFSNMQNMATNLLANAKREGRDFLTPQEYTEGMQKGIALGLYKPSDLMAMFKGDPDVIGPGPKPQPGSPEEMARNKRIYNKAFAMANSSTTANKTVTDTLGMLPPTEAERFKAFYTPEAMVGPAGQPMTVPRGQIFPGITGGPTGAGTPGGPPPGGAMGAPAAGALAPAASGPGPAPAGAMPAAPAPQGAVTGLAPHEAEQAKWFGDKYIPSVQSAAAQATNLGRVIGQINEERKGFKGGAGTTSYVAFARLLQALGFQNATVDKVAGGSLGAIEATDKLELQNAVGLLRQQLLSTQGEGSAGRLALREFEAYVQRNINLDTDPRAVQKMLAYGAKVARTAYLEQASLQHVQSMADQGKGLPTGMTRIWQFPAHWNQLIQKKGYLDPVKEGEEEGFIKSFLSDRAKRAP